MKKEIYIGLGIAALLIYLNYQHKKEKEQRKSRGGGDVGLQPAPVMYWGIPFQYGGGGDVNQNVNVYQTQSLTSPTSTPIQAAPIAMGGRGGGKGK